MLNVYFLVNDPPSKGPMPTFAAAMEALPRAGEVVAFETDGIAYKVLLVQHHLGGAMRATLGQGTEDDEQDVFIRLNKGRSASRLAQFLEDGG